MRYNESMKKTQKTQKRIPTKKLNQLKELFLNGKSNKEISSQLHIVYRMVQYHTGKIKKEQNKPKLGRPKIKLDYVLIGELTDALCTQKQVASILGVSISKLKEDTEFMAIYSKSIAYRKYLLQKNLLELSKTNATMGIFLAKNYLGLTNEPEPAQKELPNKITFEYITSHVEDMTDEEKKEKGISPDYGEQNINDSPEIEESGDQIVEEC